MAVVWERSPHVQRFWDAAPKVQGVWWAHHPKVQRVPGAQPSGMRGVWEAASPQGNESFFKVRVVEGCDIHNLDLCQLILLFILLLTHM